jgi:putative secretion ATPase (PEP-CTERM system associated)
VYLEFYGLQRRPFDMTPDPLFFFPSQKHTEALASLRYTLTARRGFVVITGEIGSGKTTVCRTLLQQLDAAARVALVTNTTLTPRQLLEAICVKFGLPCENQTKVAILSRLNRFLTEQNDAGKTVVLILDEAQNLSVKALEEIRLISNMETNTQKLVQIMFLGQPELRDKLNRPDLEQLRQRICLRYHLRSLDRGETRRYIEHRLSIAGDEGHVKFTRGALDSLYEFSKGVPRLINVVCDQALLTGYLRDTRRIDQAIVREIVAEFRTPAEEEGEPEDSYREGRSFSFRRFFRRRRSPAMGRAEVPNSAPSPEGTKEHDEESEPMTPYEETDVLGKLTELKLASIAAENGSFVATINGVHLKAGDSLFGMRVARVDEDRIVFGLGDKRYQLTIEIPGDGGDGGTASLEPGATTFPEAGLSSS